MTRFFRRLLIAGVYTLGLWLTLRMYQAIFP